MNFGLLLCAVLVPVFLDTVWVALFRARPVGKFKVLRSGTALFQFESNFGMFTILPKEGKLNFKCDSGAGSLSRDDIKGLEYRVRESVAVLEEAFFGINVTDVLSRYVDTIDWFSLVVVARDGRRVPLFLSGQYTPREFLLGWYIDLQAWLLAKLGLLKDVEQQSRQAMELVRSNLGCPPLL